MQFYIFKSADPKTVSQYGDFPLGLSQPLSKITPVIIPKDRKLVEDLEPGQEARVQAMLNMKDSPGKFLVTACG